MRTPELEAHWVLLPYTPTMSSSPHHSLKPLAAPCLERSTPVLSPEWLCMIFFIDSWWDSFSKDPKDVHICFTSHLLLHHTFVFPEPDRAWGFQALFSETLVLNLYIFGEHERIVGALIHLQYLDKWNFLSCLYVYRTKCSLWRECPAVITWWSIYTWIKDVVCFKRAVLHH